MLARLRALDPGRPIHQILFYRVCRLIVLAIFKVFYRVRFHSRENVPRTGGLLVIANHQSHLDPPLVGLALNNRNMAAIARAGLFRVPVLGLLLRLWGCIAIKEEEGDAGAMRKAIEQLKAGRVVVIFPEGTRSPDGALQAFKRGVWVLMMRSGVPVIPAAVEGCFDAWPRDRKYPRVFGQRIAFAFGRAIPFADLKAMGSEAGLDRLATEVETLRMDLRRRMREATKGRLPRPGAGDARWVPKASHAAQAPG